ncbi:MAG: DUF6151 family protein [Pseudomonadota bacterium]|nr:DUF6151 family protein [Pseudomonadota bacterium]
MAFGCACGAVSGRVDPCTRHSGTHVLCFCADCRRADLHLDQPDPANAGAGLFISTADTVSFATGVEKLACFQLSRSGPLRRYASCCRSPLFNTSPKRQFPFVAIHVGRLAAQEALGPVRLRTFRPTGNGRSRHSGNPIAFFQVVGRVLAARLSGRWRKTPFFNEASGRPVVAPERIT